MKKILFALAALAFVACKKPAKIVDVKNTATTQTSTSDTTDVTPTDVKAITPGEIKIAYVMADTVLEKFTYYQKVKANLTAKGTKLEKELQNKANAMQQEYEGYQKRGQNMSPKELQEAEMSLMKKQQDLADYRDKQTAALMKEEEALNKDLQKKIEKFLDSYAVKNGYTFILSKHIGGSVLYGQKELDITQDVIKGLNASVTK